MKKETLENWNPGRDFLTVRSGRRSRDGFSFVYPYQYLEDLPVKVSVSELKKRNYHSEQDLEETVDYETEEEIQPLVSPIYRGEERGRVYRGTSWNGLSSCNGMPGLSEDSKQG